MDYPSFTDSTMEVLFVVDPGGIEPPSAILQVTPIYDNHRLSTAFYLPPIRLSSPPWGSFKAEEPSVSILKLDERHRYLCWPALAPFLISQQPAREGLLQVLGSP